MGKKYKNLFESVVDESRLWESYRRASKGKRQSYGHLLFQQNEALNLSNIRNCLISGEYTPGDFTCFKVYDPKERLIKALPFLDRVVQHSLHSVLEPIFDRTFLPNSYACREGKGVHRGVVKAQSIMRKPETKHYLKVDFKGYFYNIDRGVLWEEISRKVSCKNTMRLLELFHPKAGTGIPIGNLTSQLMANIYGNIMDRYLTHVLKIKDWIRYMDDTVIFGSSRRELESILALLTNYVESYMKLNWSKWYINSVDRGLNFLGYRIWESHKLIRKDSVIRAKRKIRRLSGDELDRFKASWEGHIKWANSYNLKTSIKGSI